MCEGRKMNPELCILKGKPSKDSSDRKNVYFAIIDQDKTTSYPRNFLCVLPKHMNASSVDTSVFTKIFKEQRIDVAKKLLTKALQTEDDPRIKKEISNRLKQLTPKPAWQAHRCNTKQHIRVKNFRFK